MGDINYFYIMMAAALAATGDLNKVDDPAAKALAEKLNGNGLRLYPSTDSIGAGMKSGEIDVGIMWLARVIMWQNAGIPVKQSFPDRGLGAVHLRHGRAQERRRQAGRLQIPQRHAGAVGAEPASPSAWATCPPSTTAR